MSQARRQFLGQSAAATAAGVVAGLGIASQAAAKSPSNTKSSMKKEKSMSQSNNSYLQFNTSNTALVLVDHQVGTINWAGELANEEERNQLKMWTKVIARFAKGAGMPIVLTSSMEDKPQGPLLPEFKDIMPQEYAARIKRTGVINAWDDPAFAKAVRATGKKNLLMGGLTTEVCLVPPALSAKAEGFNVVALLDISGANTRLGADNSRDALNRAGINCMTVTPMLTSMLGDYTNPVARFFFEAFEKEGVFGAFAKGNLR
jgi:nicotinamidase-related amidase